MAIKLIKSRKSSRTSDGSFQDFPDLTAVELAERYVADWFDAFLTSVASHHSSKSYSLDEDSIPESAFELVAERVLEDDDNDIDPEFEREVSLKEAGYLIGVHVGLRLRRSEITNGLVPVGSPAAGPYPIDPDRLSATVNRLQQFVLEHPDRAMAIFAMIERSLDGDDQEGGQS